MEFKTIFSLPIRSLLKVFVGKDKQAKEAVLSSRVIDKKKNT